MITVLMIAGGAVLGAPARYLTDKAVQSRHDTTFPWGTLTVNVIACLVLGVVTAAARHVSSDLVTLVGPGFCASLSTYSTFSFETVRLVENGDRFRAAFYVLFSVAAGGGAATLGYALGAGL